MNRPELNIPYHAFEDFVFRAPMFPLKFVEDRSKEEIFNLIQNRDPIIDHALYIASPNLHRKLDRWTAGELKEKSLNFDLSLLKYVTRMSTRCTPFGLFAGIGMGRFGERNEIVLDRPEEHTTHTKLSQDYLYALYSRISRDPEVERSTTYLTNNTLYRKHNHFRYIEYKDEKKHRKYTLSSVELNGVLQDLTNMCLQGATWEQLIRFLIKKDISQEDAENYLRLLIENKVITNQLEPTPISEDSFTQFIQTLCSKGSTSRHYHFCQDLHSALQKFDEMGIGMNVSEYQYLHRNLKDLLPNLEASKAFHVDVGLRTTTATLDHSIIEEVQKGVDALNRLTPPTEHQFLSRFKTQFFSRYENEEIPLIEALDSEGGIPVDDTDKKDINPMIDDIPLGGLRENEYLEINLQQRFILEKYFDYLENQQSHSMPDVMELNEEEIKRLPVNWDDIPVTFGVMAEIVGKSEGNPSVYLKAVTGINAAKTLSRFHQLSPEMKNLIAEIAAAEKRYYADSVIAEILHIPQTRVGNVLIRPDVYDYQIPIVIRSNKPQRYQIPVHDLMISVVNGQNIVLRSKKLNKWVIPRLSTAHNFTNNSIPIYRFLCYVQMQHLRPDLSFRWNSLIANRKFLPRVCYGNVVLSTATWSFSAGELPGNLDVESGSFHRTIAAFREKHRLPRKVLHSRGDHKLLVDFNKLEPCQMFYEEVKNKPFTLKEFFHDTGYSFITDQDHRGYAGEFVFGFYRKPN